MGKKERAVFRFYKQTTGFSTYTTTTILQLNQQYRQISDGFIVCTREWDKGRERARPTGLSPLIKQMTRIRKKYGVKSKKGPRFAGVWNWGGGKGGCIVKVHARVFDPNVR